MVARMDRAPRNNARSGEGDGTMSRKAHTWGIVAIWAMAMGAAVPAVGAQSVHTGVVTNEMGSAIPGVVITVRTQAGATVQTVTTDAAGAFSLRPLTPGQYEIEAEHPHLERTRAAVTVTQSDPVAPVHLVMRVAAVVEHTVVTGRRIETRLSETPQKIEIVDARDIERSVAADLTDVLKKNAGVDVVQYSGVLSGIGIRGFRPEFSGTNKRSLLLIDGRPSGVTNVATLQLGNVERIEVLKGPASALYGASAMGGVVNVVTRRSRGPLGGRGSVAFGSFDSTEFAGRAGGSLSSRLDFDVTGSAFHQRDDFRMGNGVVRPATSYKTYDGSARLGVDLGAAWRLDTSVSAYRGRDINTPGDVFNGITSQGRKNLKHDAADLRLSGQIARHLLSGTVYTAGEQGDFRNVTTTNPLDQPFLPYLTFVREANWTGAQIRDAWRWSSANNLVIGVDYERVTSRSQSYTRTGARQAPFSADNGKRTTGVYGENTLSLRDGRTVVSLGGRVDRIHVETFTTPLKANFTPSTTSFTTFNPSAGVKQQIVGGLRVHGTVGRAFVPADAAALTGFTTDVIGGRMRINQGNPDLKPEHSVSLDVGLELFTPSTHVDVTYFRTQVSNRVVSNVVVSNPAPPDPIVLSSVNTLAARIRGMDIDIEHRVNPVITVFSNVTHYFSRREQLPTAGERNILNVATSTARAGVDVDAGRLSGRLLARYVRGRQDQDFTVAGAPVVDYPTFTVADLSAAYRVHAQHAVQLHVNNLFDTFYYEKKGYPLQGRTFSLRYRIGL